MGSLLQRSIAASEVISSATRLEKPSSQRAARISFGSSTQRTRTSLRTLSLASLYVVFDKASCVRVGPSGRGAFSPLLGILPLISAWEHPSAHAHRLIVFLTEDISNGGHIIWPSGLSMLGAHGPANVFWRRKKQGMFLANLRWSQ